MELFWIADAGAPLAEFKAEFDFNGGTAVIEIFGCPRFVSYLDGQYLTEGPYRFDAAHPCCERIEIELSKGRHTVTAEVVNENVETRILKKLPPCFGLSVCGAEIKTEARKKEGMRFLRRINPQLGWAEIRDLSVPDGQWTDAVRVSPPIGEMRVAEAKSIKRLKVAAKEINKGLLTDRFGYEDDDPPARFLMRSLTVEETADGIWIRYDLGKVRLFRVEFVIDAPEGTVVECAYSELLTEGRVAPFINLSAGTSCNMDRYFLSGGESVVRNLTPRGGRYVELHVLADPEMINIKQASFYERSYFGEPDGSFRCGDELIDRIWQTGVETTRSCAEDAIIDNPARERGEWTGDVISVGIDIISAAYDDYSLIKRGLTHSALCASADGCIAGLCPGGAAYLSSYALQWINACRRYYNLTGDIEFFKEIYPYAVRNLKYFQSHFTPDGLDSDVYWNFIDWGYVTNAGKSDMALNIYLYSALKVMTEWSRIAGDAEGGGFYADWLYKTESIVKKYIDDCGGDFAKMGLHRSTLALSEGLIDKTLHNDCIEFIKRHYRNCFPNETSAPRLGSPSKNNPRLITPYFSHYALKALWEKGEGDFAIEQYRACWGWMLTKATTWLEVFDTRWSHCHQWSGCPTWQLSRYVLGLEPRFDLGERVYDFVRKDCSIRKAEGRLPVYGGGIIDISLEGGKTTVRPDRDITVIRDGVKIPVEAGSKKIF